MNQLAHWLALLFAWQMTMQTIENIAAFDHPLQGNLSMPGHRNGLMLV